MTHPSGRIDSPAETGIAPTDAAERPQMLMAQAALRMLCHRTGGNISKTTFYRWVECGRIPSVRLGKKILIPRKALEELIQKCYSVD